MIRMSDVVGVAAEVEPVAEDVLARELAGAVNRVCAENGSNTPDFVLGDFLAAVTAAWDRGVRARDRWYGLAPAPGGLRSPLEEAPDIANPQVLERYGDAFALAREAQAAGLVVLSLAPIRCAHGGGLEYMVSLWTPDGKLWMGGSHESTSLVRAAIRGWKRAVVQ